MTSLTNEGVVWTLDRSPCWAPATPLLSQQFPHSLSHWIAPAAYLLAGLPNRTFNISWSYYIHSRKMDRESKSFKQDGGAYPKSGGNSSLIPKVPWLYLLLSLLVTGLACSFSLLPAGWLPAGLAPCWVAGWLLDGWLAAGQLAGCCWLLSRWAGSLLGCL